MGFHEFIFDFVNFAIGLVCIKHDKCTFKFNRLLRTGGYLS